MSTLSTQLSTQQSALSTQLSSQQSALSTQHSQLPLTPGGSTISLVTAARSSPGDAMQCPRCGVENREGSNFCRYCSAPLEAGAGKPDSGYIPTVPPPNATDQGYRPPPVYETPQPKPARRVVPPLTCPRCSAPSVVKGTTPLWAILVAIIGAPFTCFLSLFFLLLRDPNRCMNCGLQYK